MAFLNSVAASGSARIEAVQAEAVVRGGELRREPQRFPELRFGLVQTPDRRQRRSQVVMGHRVVGLRTDRFDILRTRFLHPVQRLVAHADVVARLDQQGIQT